MRSRPITRRRESLLGRVLALNLLLVVTTLLAVTLASGFDLRQQPDRWQFALLAMMIIATLLVNILLLRRRFSPLGELIERIEAIDVAKPVQLRLPEEEELEEVGRLAAAFRRLVERIEEERRSGGQLVLRAHEVERRRVARDLHDEVNQALTAILLRLEAISQDAPPGVADELSELKALTNRAMDELLQLARQLRPTALDEHGLVPAIEGQVERFAEQTGIEATLKTEGDASALSDDKQVAVYRVAQEALSNVVSHADARRVEVELAAVNGRVELRVRDDGRGFEPSAPRTGLGVSGMAERARLMGGELSIDSEPGGGTSLTLRLP